MTTAVPLSQEPVAEPVSVFSRRALWCASILAGLGLFLLPFLMLLFYSPPATDDFCKATLAFDTIPQPGVIAVTWLYYTKWSARWLTTMLQSFVMSKVDLISGYGWLLLLVVIATIAALTYFFRAVLGFGRRTSVLAAGIFYAAWLAGSIQPATNIYWLTGALEYQLPLCTLLVLVGVLCRYDRSIRHKLLLAALAIAVPAQHEIGGAFLCALLLGGFMVYRLKGVAAWHWAAAAALVLVSLAVVMASPGNAARAAAEHRQLWDGSHAVWWFKHAFLYKGLDWILRGGILAGCCCIALVSRWERSPNPGVPGKGLGVFALCALVVLLIEYAFLEVTTGAELPGRVVGWFQFVFWLLMVCVLVCGVPELHDWRFSITSTAGVFLLFAVSLFGSTNFRDAVAEVRGPAQQWWRGNAARLAQRGEVLEFPPVQYPAIGQLTMRQQVTPDSACWVNRCMANYLHARAVVAKGSTEVCPQ